MRKRFHSRYLNYMQRERKRCYQNTKISLFGYLTSAPKGGVQKVSNEKSNKIFLKKYAGISELHLYLVLRMRKSVKPKCVAHALCASLPRHIEFFGEKKGQRKTQNILSKSPMVNDICKVLNWSIHIMLL